VHVAAIESMRNHLTSNPSIPPPSNATFKDEGLHHEVR
jgi:hypothetical protein